MAIRISMGVCVTFVALAIVLSGCHPTTDAMAGEQFDGARTNLDTLGISLVIPDGWEIRRSPTVVEDGKLTLSSVLLIDTTASALRSIAIERHDRLNPWERLKWTIGWERRRDSHFDLVEKIPSNDLRMPFSSGSGFVYRFAGKHGPPARLNVFYTVVGSRAYRILAGGSEAEFDAMQHDYQRVLRSIDFDI